MSNAPGDHHSDPYEFSPILGAPLFQLTHRAHLSGDALELLRRRIITIVIIAWLPLVFRSLLDQRAWGGVPVPFLLDVEIHLRLLVALPLLIAAELVVHKRLRSVVRQFVERGLVPETSHARFETV